MRYAVIAVLALVLGAIAARSYYKQDELEPVDPINVDGHADEDAFDHRA